MTDFNLGDGQDWAGQPARRHPVHKELRIAPVGWWRLHVEPSADGGIDRRVNRVVAFTLNEDDDGWPEIEPWYLGGAIWGADGTNIYQSSLGITRFDIVDIVHVDPAKADTPEAVASLQAVLLDEMEETLRRLIGIAEDELDE